MTDSHDAVRRWIERETAREREALLAPWTQLSGKYLSVDTGQSPQVFEAIGDKESDLILAMRNDRAAVIAVVEAAAQALGWLDENEPNGGGVVREVLRDALARLAAIGGE